MSFREQASGKQATLVGHLLNANARMHDCNMMIQSYANESRAGLSAAAANRLPLTDLPTSTSNPDEKHCTSNPNLSHSDAIRISVCM
jgi:hypothetical protein